MRSPPATGNARHERRAFLDLEWWRRRESNPRPKLPDVGVYVCRSRKTPPTRSETKPLTGVDGEFGRSFSSPAATPRDGSGLSRVEHARAPPSWHREVERLTRLYAARAKCLLLLALVVFCFVVDGGKAPRHAASTSYNLVETVAPPGWSIAPLTRPEPGVLPRRCGGPMRVLAAGRPGAVGAVKGGGACAPSTGSNLPTPGRRVKRDHPGWSTA